MWAFANPAAVNTLVHRSLCVCVFMEKPQKRSCWAEEYAQFSGDEAKQASKIKWSLEIFSAPSRSGNSVCSKF
jgi:hypothetical protein